MALSADLIVINTGLPGNIDKVLMMAAMTVSFLLTRVFVVSPKDTPFSADLAKLLTVDRQAVGKVLAVVLQLGLLVLVIREFSQEYRAEKALAALKQLLPFYVRVLRNGKEEEIPARDVVPGDIMLLAEGDKIPADARLVESS